MEKEIELAIKKIKNYGISKKHPLKKHYQWFLEWKKEKLDEIELYEQAFEKLFKLENNNKSL